MKLLYADSNLNFCGEPLNEVMDKYGRWKNAVEEKGLRVTVDKTNGMQLLFGKKSSVSKVDPYGVCGERMLVIILLKVRNARSGFIVVLICLGRCVFRYVFVCRICLDHNSTVEEYLDCKRGEDVLGEVEKFCYLGDMNSCCI